MTGIWLAAVLFGVTLLGVALIVWLVCYETDTWTKELPAKQSEHPLCSLAQMAGCPTPAEAARRSLVVYEFLVQVRLRGGKVLIQEASGEQKELDIGV